MMGLENGFLSSKYRVERLHFDERASWRGPTVLEKIPPFCACPALVPHGRGGRDGRGQNPTSQSKSSAPVDRPRYRVFCNRPSIKEVTAIQRRVVESGGNQAKSEQIALKTNRVNFIQRSLVSSPDTPFFSTSFFVLREHVKTSG